jgi:regulator of replication initiation timing
MEETVEGELQDLRQSLVEKEERIKRLVGENITLVTENMKLAYEAKWLRNRVEFLELYGKGYTFNGMVESKEDYIVVLIKKGKSFDRN